MCFGGIHIRLQVDVGYLSRTRSLLDLLIKWIKMVEICSVSFIHTFILFIYRSYMLVEPTRNTKMLAIRDSYRFMIYSMIWLSSYFVYPRFLNSRESPQLLNTLHDKLFFIYSSIMIIAMLDFWRNLVPINCELF